MALTEEKKELVQNVVNQLKTDSQSVDELETVDTLEGVVSLPAMRGEKVVGAPLKLLSKPAEEAAAVVRKLAVVADASAKKADASAKKAGESAKKADATVATMSGYEDRVKLAMNGASARFDGFVEDVVVELMSVTSVDGIYYDKTNKRFCAKKGDRYYNNWVIGNDVNAASMYLDDGRKTPRKDKMYVCGTCLYVWNDKEDDLVVVDKTTKELGTWLITHENVTTIDALNQELDAFDAKTAQGLHRVKCWGIPLLVTFANLDVGDNVLMQTIYGSLTMKSDGSGIASINSIGQHAIFVRYYNNGKWNSWGRYGAIAQDGVEGTSKHYVYSSASDETRCVLSSKMWTYVHTDGNLFLRFKKWGANNDTVAQDYSQVMLTGRVSNDKWGLMNPYVYARLNNHTLTEGLSTLDEVKVNYTRFDDSGNKVLTLTKATTAKAGVMTAGDKTLLSGLGKHLHPDPDNLTTLEALNTALDAMGPDTAQGTHHLSCWGIPLAVTLAVLNVGDKVLMQTITGSITTNTAATALATINAPGHYTTLVRYYQEGKWGIWASIGDSISASINVSQLDTYFMKEDDKGGVVVDMVKCKNAKPIYVVVDDEGNRVGLLFTHSDTMKHCLVLNLLTHLKLKDDGSLDATTHSHTYDYPKFYRKNLGFKFFSNAGESDPSYFEKLHASKWYCPLDEQFKEMVPTLQGGAAGDGKKYIYSQGGSDNTRTVLGSKMWIRQNDAYDQFLCFKHWGATNDTSESQCSQVMLPKAWIGGTGLLRWDIYRRLDAFELREQNSTATEVKIVTPIFTTGGTRELSISQATTAKAGVMTAADKSKLDGLSDISAEGARAAKALYKATGGTKLFGPNNIFDTNNRTLGGVVNKTLYDSSTPTEYTKGSPFEVFCTQGIKSDVDSKKYMIWFGLRKSATYIERYSCQQVIGQTEAEFYVYGTPVAFRLNNGEVYTPQQGSGGLEIGTSTKYIVSRECVIPSYSDLHDAATSEKDGLMSAADKAQLDVIAASMDSFGNSITEQAKRIYDLEQCKPLATKSRNGFMSSGDKTQLQGAFADFNARQRANDVEGYVGKSNVISVPGAVGTTKIAADIYRNAEERDYTPGASFGVYISAGYDENNPNKQCVWFGFPIEATKFVRYRLDYWLHGTADTLVGKYLCDTNDKYYAVREGAVGEYISEALDDTPCIMTIADKRLLNQIKKKLGL